MSKTIGIYDEAGLESLEMSESFKTSEPKAIGSRVQLVFQAKYPTFTPDQFDKALKKRNFIVITRPVVNTQNPQASPITIQMFSKEDINVFLSPNRPNQIVFQILNTVRLGRKYEGIQKILLDLNFFPEVISNIGFTCITRSDGKTEPKACLTSLVKPEFLDGIAKELEKQLRVTSIRMATSFPLEKEGLQLILEPLATSTKNEYYLNISYQTTNQKKFDEFVSKFGQDMIQEIVKRAEKSG